MKTAQYGTLWLVLALVLVPAYSAAQNPYYDHGAFPEPGTIGSSAGMRAELDLIEAGFAKLPTLSGNANKIVVVNGSATALTATDAPIPSGTTFPVSPSTGALFVVTDDSASGACDSDAGTEVTLCRWNGSAWVGLGGGGTSGLEANFVLVPEISSATSANPLKVGNGTQKLDIYGDATQGGVIRPVPLGDSLWRIWTNFNGCIRDEEAGALMLCFDPDAASPNAMFQFQTGYKPLLSFPVPLEPRGAATSASASLTTNVPKQWYLTVTDANTDAADFSFPVTARMAGATTMTFRLIGVSVNATPSGNIDLDCAAYTYTPGTDTIAAHSTTGEVTVLLTPATQYRPVAATSAAHTINGGALVAGDIVYGSCEVDATATTSAQMTDFRLYGNVIVTLSANSWSD